MEYLLNINRDILDRFKVYKGGDLVITGRKSGNQSSFFDGYIGTVYAKGADYVLEGEEELTISRIFYDDVKKYEFPGGHIYTAPKDGSYLMDAELSGRKFRKIIHPGDRTLRLEGIGRIIPEPRGFKAYRTIRLELEDPGMLMELTVAAVYIWDVFMKRRKAFI